MNATMKSLIAKFKANFIPTRDEHLAIYLQTGEIAKAVKPERGEPVTTYRTFINGQLFEVPAALVTTKLPVFRINKPVDQLVVGDIIRTGNGTTYTYRRVDALLPNGKIATTSFNGATNNQILAINDLLLGSATVSCAVNFMKGFMGNGQNPMQNNMLMPFLMLSEGDSFLDGDNGLDTMLMFSMMGGNAMNMQSLMPLMLLSGDKFGGEDKMSDIMMMSMMMGGNNAANPFASLFAGLMPQTAAPVVTATSEAPAEAVPVATTAEGNDAQN